MALRGGPLTHGRLLRGGALLGPSGAVAGGGTWTQVFAWNATTLVDEVGWNTYTVVATIDIDDFSATGGTRCRLTFVGATTEGFIVNAMYIGNGGGTDLYDFGDTPVQMKLGGSTTITVGAGATVVTDDVAFVKDATNTFVIAMQFSNSAADNIKRNSNTSNQGDSYYKIAAEAATQNKTSYLTNLASAYVAKIELLI